MKYLIALALAAVASAQVSQSVQQLGNTGNYALTFTWTADASGVVPITAAQLQSAGLSAQGLRVLQVQTVPLSPAPTNNYSVQILDGFSGDMMGGAMASVSNASVQYWAATSATPPILGTFSLHVYGNSVANAQGKTVVYFGPQSVINATAGSPGPAGPAGPTGPTGPTGTGLVLNTDYQFTRTPGGTLSSGVSANVTLTPCPSGISGTSPNHYVYISGGTGTAEAVLITGGTCTSGATSGTIIFTPANSHSGAWTVSSATAGIQEAVRATPDYSAIWIPTASAGHLTYATATIDRGNTLRGTGKYGPIRCQFNNSNCVQFINGSGIQGYIGADSLMVYSDVAAGSSGSMVLVKDKVQGYVNDIELPFNSYTGLEMDNGTVATSSLVQYRGVTIGAAKSIGVWDKSCGGNKYGFSITVANTATASLYISSPVGCSVSGLYYIGYNGFGGQNTVFLDNSIGNKTVNEVHFTSPILDNCQVNCFALSDPALTSNGSIIEVNGGEMASLANGIIVGKGWQRVLLHPALITVQNVGIQAKGAAGLDIFGTRIVGSAAFSHAIQLVDSNQDGSGTPNTNVRIVGNTLGYSQAGACSGNAGQIGIYFRSTSTQTAFVDGNDICGTTYTVFSDSTTTKPTFAANKGLIDSIPAVASAATLAFPFNPNFTITGTTGVTAVTVPTAAGSTGTFITTGGAVAFSSGSSIGNSCTTTQNKLYTWTWDGTKVWIAGTGC